MRVRRFVWQIFAGLRRKRWEQQYKKNSANSQIVPEAFGKIKYCGLTDLKPEDISRSWLNNTVATAENPLQHRYNCLALDENDTGLKKKRQQRVQDETWDSKVRKIVGFIEENFKKGENSQAKRD